MFDQLITHPWDLEPKAAIALQRKLADRVVEEPVSKPVRTVAGIDVSVRGERLQTAVVVLDLETLNECDRAVWRGKTVFPYIPGLLSFREIPAIMPALEQLTVRPDLLMLDGHGRAHPRRFGLACHLGVLLDWPSIGVAKTRLTGTFEEPGKSRGSESALWDQDERIGSVVRTRSHVNPVFVSVGHRVTLADAVRLTLAATGRYKIPEPTRQAHHLSRESFT